MLRVQKSVRKSPYHERLRELLENVTEKQYFPLSEVVIMKGIQLADLFEACREMRPAKRRLQFSGEVFRTMDSVIVSLVDDLTYLPNCIAGTICVEIKPKWGFLPNLASKSRSKSRVCRYGRHQVLKLHDGEIDRVSRYCPLDLFSGDRQRTRIALESLIQDPQNNFRIFVDGIVVDAAELMQIDLDADTLIETLSDTILSRQHVLKILQFLQMQDIRDIENLYPIFASFLKQSSNSIEEVESLVQEAIMTQSFSEILKEELAAFLKEPRQPLSCDLHYPSTWIGNRPFVPTELSVLQLLGRFLVSTAAKDASLMIAFPQHASPDTCIADARIGIVDVDFKPLSKLKHWYDLDQYIDEIFEQTTKGS